MLGLVFYPVILLVTTPTRLLQTLWNCRILTESKWSDYAHFNPQFGINSLFYWTQAKNLHQYGRNGTSPSVGLGHYFLGKWWHLSYLASYAYWKNGCVIPLIGMFGWWIGHFVWLDYPGINCYWFAGIACLALISTTFYANIFVLQNYNAIGWIFMPIGLYGLISGNWILAALAWLGASFGSITVVFFAGILSVAFAIQLNSILPLLVLLPAVFKIATHFWPFLFKQKLAESVAQTGKIIGLFRTNVKYKREMRLGIRQIYCMVIAAQFLIAYWAIAGIFPWILLIAIFAYFINTRFLRLADTQNVFMLTMSISTFLILQSEQKDWILLLSYWISISPIPAFTGIPRYKSFFTVPVLKPFHITPLLKDMEHFLQSVKKDQRVLMAFENPGDNYDMIFDGYRVLLELPLYVAARKCFHFMPDWYGIFELNYEGAPHFWGREPATVLKQMQTWTADYVVVYQKSGTELNNKWQNANFEIISHFSWAKYEKKLQCIKPYVGCTPDWWLLQKI
jgi:hypothetical protein